MSEPPMAMLRSAMFTPSRIPDIETCAAPRMTIPAEYQLLTISFWRNGIPEPPLMNPSGSRPAYLPGSMLS